MNSEKVLELGVQKSETLEELKMQYLQALAKPEQEIISHNTLLEAFTIKATRIAFCLPVFSRFFIATIRPIET